MRFYEICSSCLKQLVFYSERSRQLAINEQVVKYFARSIGRRK